MLYYLPRAANQWEALFYGPMHAIFGVLALKGLTLATEAQRRAKVRYDAKTVQYMVRLRKGADADLIAHLAGVGNRTEYFRNLIRRDINDNK